MTVFGSRYLILSFFLFPIQGIVSIDVRATVGQDVTLRCNYNATYYGPLHTCWGRGYIPYSGCARELIKSDGTSFIGRRSDRYCLLGNVVGGDVSLTIKQVNEGDSGMYSCRVEVSGWFNDQKHYTTLTVVAVRPDPPKIETSLVEETSVTVRWTLGFNGGKPFSSYRIDRKHEQASWDTAESFVVSNTVLTHLTLTGMRPATSYNLRMSAANSMGMSEASNVLTVTSKEAAPEGPPLDVNLEGLTSTSINVTWKPPRPDLRNGVLQSYSVSYSEYNASLEEFKEWQHLNVLATRDLESVTLSNLKPSTKYVIIIQAKTNAGIGPASDAPRCSTLEEVRTASTASASTSTSTAATMRTQDTGFTSVQTFSMVESVTGATVRGDNTTSNTSVPPDPPVLELKEAKDYMISLSWTPGYEGDSPITGYYLEHKEVNASWDYIEGVHFGPYETEATLEFYPSTYNMRMFSMSHLGTSKASNVLTITSGHHTDDLVTTNSTDSHAAVSVKETGGGHLLAIVVPMVLVVMIVAVLIGWQFRRLKKNDGSPYTWLGGGMRYDGSDSLQEL